MINKEKIKEIIYFYKEAYCVDGEVKVLKTTTGFKVGGGLR